MSKRHPKEGRGELKRQPSIPGPRRDASQTSRLARLASAFSIWPTVSPVRLKTQWHHLVVVFVALFSLYAYSAPRTVALEDDGDRKSTRLNSSHTVISYAVFCLKKKTT